MMSEVGVSMPGGAQICVQPAPKQAQTIHSHWGVYIDPPQWMGVGRSMGGSFYSHGSGCVPYLRGFLSTKPMATPTPFSVIYSHFASGSNPHVLTPKRACPASVSWYSSSSDFST